MPSKKTSQFLMDAAAYLENRDAAAAYKKPAEKMKPALRDYINAHGKKDDEGDIIVTFPMPITVGDKTYSGLKQVRREVPVYDEDACMKLVRKKKLLAEIPAWTEYDWENGLHRLNALKKITDDELDAVMDNDVTWALTVINE